MTKGLTLASKCRELMGSPENWTPPPGYEGMALAILDAIWSIGVRYESVTVPVLDRYRAWVRKNRSADPSTSTTSELVSDINAAGGPIGFAADVVANRNRTSSRNGVLKAEAVYKAASVLKAFGIDTPGELARAAKDPKVKQEWRTVPGQSSGLTWRYLLMNARIEDVKADRMICRFVENALDMKRVSQSFAYEEVRAAHAILVQETPNLTLRGLDHAMWRYSREKLGA